MSMTTLAEDRKNISHDKPLHFVRSILDANLIFAYCAERKTRILHNALLNAVKVLGQACVRAHTVGRLSFAAALESLVVHRKYGVSDRCARVYIQHLLDAGVLHKAPSGMLQMANFAGDMQPFTQEFFDRRSAHQRQGGARRAAKYRAAKLTDGQNPQPQAYVIVEEKHPVTSQYLNPSRTRTKTNPQAGALTQAAFALPPDLLDPAKVAPSAPIPAPPKPVAAPVVVRVRAPNKPAQLTDADIDAVDALSPQPEAGGKTDYAAWASRIARTWTDAEVDASRAKDAAAKPVQQGTPSEAAAPPADRPRPKPSAPVTVPQLRELAENHGRLLDGHDINFIALFNAKPSYDLARQALDVTVVALRDSAQGQRKAIGNAGGYWLNTIRYMRGGS